jgi:hypothetical protein
VCVCGCVLLWLGRILFATDRSREPR